MHADVTPVTGKGLEIVRCVTNYFARGWVASYTETRASWKVACSAGWWKAARGLIIPGSRASLRPLPACGFRRHDEGCEDGCRRAGRGQWQSVYDSSYAAGGQARSAKVQQESRIGLLLAGEKCLAVLADIRESLSPPFRHGTIVPFSPCRERDIASFDQWTLSRLMPTSSELRSPQP